MAQLVECVPNISEGRDKDKIRRIVSAVEQVGGVTLLDVDPGAATNRTVITFVGGPEAVQEAAFRLIAKAQQEIDMRDHKGEHARMGATDVCPFVPVAGCSMDDCARWAAELGERVGRELRIPVYLYENAATRPERRNLADVRSGEYEGLGRKLADPAWAPDFGPAGFGESQQRSGATAISAREFLIAYNINFNSRDKKLAHDVALTVREAGRFGRDAAGKFIRNAEGRKVRQPGLLKSVKAVGWYIEEYGRAQLSMNLTNYRDTPFHVAFDTVKEEGEKRGLRVTGSELVGLLPLEPVLEAGRHYLRQQGKLQGVTEEELVRTAILSMGLDDLGPFDPREKIIEYRVRQRPDALVDLSVRGFADLLSSDAPAPGGGSTAALCGALAAGLAAMVASLTHGRKEYREHDEAMDTMSLKAQRLKEFFLAQIDRDTDAFNEVMAAMRLPKKSEEEQQARQAAIEQANRSATLVPFGVVEACAEALECAALAAAHGNRNSLSDAGVAALALGTAIDGAAMNVRINLAGIEDRAWAKDLDAKTRALQETFHARRREILDQVEKELAFVE